MANFKYDQQKRFIKNIAPNIEEELGGGGSSENSTGSFTISGEYSVQVNFAELKAFVEANNIDLTAELTTESESACIVLSTIVDGGNLGMSGVNAYPNTLTAQDDSGHLVFFYDETSGTADIYGEVPEHYSLKDCIDTLAAEDNPVVDLGYGNSNGLIVCSLGFRQGSKETADYYNISKEDWEKIVIITPVN